MGQAGAWPTAMEAAQLYIAPAVLLLVHDGWFYFTHRAMHRSRVLYRHVHALHHRRRCPTAWDLFYSAFPAPAPVPRPRLTPLPSAPA